MANKVTVWTKVAVSYWSAMDLKSYLSYPYLSRFADCVCVCVKDLVRDCIVRLSTPYVGI